MTDGQTDHQNENGETPRVQDPRDQINLAELVEATATGLVTERRKDYQVKIRQMFLNLEKLDKDITQNEKELEKKRKAFRKIKDRIDKLKAGDWSVLKDDNKQKGDNNA